MNNVAYFEIQSSDPEKTISFYEAVFGWQFVKEALMPINYWQITGADINGGLLERPAEVPPLESGSNAFVCSMQVEDFDATAAKIFAQNGLVALDKFAVPGKCWQGYFTDTDQNTFGIFQVDENAA